MFSNKSDSTDDRNSNFSGNTPSLAPIASSSSDEQSEAGTSRRSSRSSVKRSTKGGREKFKSYDDSSQSSISSNDSEDDEASNYDDDLEDEDWFKKHRSNRSSQSNQCTRPPPPQPSLPAKPAPAKGKPKPTARSRPARSKRPTIMVAKPQQQPVALETKVDYNSSNSEPLVDARLGRPRQCFGPNCVQSARLTSKYCSDECGLALAKKRITELLPVSLAINCGQSDGPSPRRPAYLADRLDQGRLEAVREEQRSIHQRLLQLESQHTTLAELVRQSRRQPQPSTAAGCDDKALMQESIDDDMKLVEQLDSVVCVTCCSEIGSRNALRHMEKCFQKMEGNTTYSSNQKEQPMGTPLFCDFYDFQTDTYCKRLRAVCEHYKEPHLPPSTPCGFPLVRLLFQPTGRFCPLPRNECVRHAGWERIHQARIDIERYRHLTHMDELVQSEQRILASMSRRGGFLGILLHQTRDVNPSVGVPLPSSVKALMASNSGPAVTTHKQPSVSPELSSSSSGELSCSSDS